MAWNDLLALIGFFVLCTLAASSGAIFKPGAWYDGLRKPSWVPPKWAFPVVWTILFIMMAVAGWMVWRQAGLAAGSTAFALFLLQLVLNACWSALFFGLRRMDLALIEVAALWAAIAATIAAFAPLSPTAAWLMAPYLLWVTIATALNLAMVRLNPR